MRQTVLLRSLITKAAQVFGLEGYGSRLTRSPISKLHQFQDPPAEVALFRLPVLWPQHHLGEALVPSARASLGESPYIARKARLNVASSENPHRNAIWEMRATFCEGCDELLEAAREPPAPDVGLHSAKWFAKAIEGCP